MPKGLLISIRLALCVCCLSGQAAPVIEAELPTTTVYGKRRLRQEPLKPTELPGESLVPEGGESSLGQVLRRSPAIEARATGGEGAAPLFLVRGLDPIQTRFFVDGVPLNDAAYNSANPALLPLEVLGRADVYAEGVPTFLGEDGLGGAINLRTEAPEGGPACRSSLFGTRIGAFGYLRGYGQTCAPGASLPWRLHLDVSRSIEDFPYFDDGGAPFNPAVHKMSRRDHNGFRRFTAFPEVTLVKSRRHVLRAFSLTSYGEKEVPGPVGIPATGNLTQWYSLGALTYRGDWAGVRLEGRAFARWDQTRLREGGESPSLIFLPSRSHDLALGTRLGVRAEGFWGTEWEALVGVGRETLRVESELGDKDVARWETPLGLTASWPVAGRYLSVRPAVLAHSYDYGVDGRHTRTEWLTSPRLGLVSHPWPAWQMRATVGRYYRAPTLVERYGSPSGISASPGLSAEHGDKGDVGVDWDLVHPFAGLKALRLSYTFGVSRTRDLISYIQNSQQTRVAVNVGQARITSHEVAVEAVTSIDIAARGGLTLLSTENQSDIVGQTGKELPLRPAHSVTASLAYRNPRWGVEYEAILRGTAYQDLVNSRRLNPFVEHNLRASWDSKVIGRFGIELLNLGDATTVPGQAGGFSTTDFSTGFFGYPAPGRRWYLTWQYEI